VDDDGAAADLSSGYTFGYLDATNTFVVGSALVKFGSMSYVIDGTFTANLTPTLESFTPKASRIPTLTFAPNAGELDSIAPGSGRGRIYVAAQSGTKQRPGWWPVIVEDPTA
jgi:hypothetical protein